MSEIARKNEGNVGSQQLGCLEKVQKTFPTHDLVVMKTCPSYNDWSETRACCNKALRETKG